MTDSYIYRLAGLNGAVGSLLGVMRGPNHYRFLYLLSVEECL